jgi:hypothetical protein
MTVISTREFSANQKKYFDMAVNNDVYIKNDKYIFHLMCKPVDMIDEQVTLQPDDDFRRAITKDELLKGIYQDIEKRFAKK